MTLAIPVEGPIEPGSRFVEADASPDGSTLYVVAAVTQGGRSRASLHAHDPASLAWRWSLPLPAGAVPAGPPQLLVSNDGSTAYVSLRELETSEHAFRQRLVRIDLAERRVEDAVDLPRERGCSGRWEPAGARLVDVCLAFASEVLVRVYEPDSGRLTSHSVPIEQVDPANFALSHAIHGSRVYLANGYEPGLAVVDLEAGTIRQWNLSQRIGLLDRLLNLLAPTVEAKPWHGSEGTSLLLSPDGRIAYLARYKASDLPSGSEGREFPSQGLKGEGIWVVDLQYMRVTDRWLEGRRIGHLEMGRDGSYLYAVDDGLPGLHVLDAKTGRVLRTVEHARFRFAVPIWVP